MNTPGTPGGISMLGRSYQAKAMGHKGAKSVGIPFTGNPRMKNSFG